MKKIDVSKLVAAALAVERVHNIIRQYLPQYTTWTNAFVDKIKRKLRLRSTLLDDMYRYLEIKDAHKEFSSNTLSMRDKPEQDYIFSLLEKHCSLFKTYSLKLEFFGSIKDLGIKAACDNEPMPARSSPLDAEGKPMNTRIVGPTILKCEDVKPELLDFFKPSRGFWKPSGFYYMNYEGVKFIIFASHEYDFDEVGGDGPTAHKLRNRELCFIANKKDEKIIVKFLKFLWAELKEFNPYACAVLTSFKYNYGQADFRYDEEQTIDLRIRNRTFDLSYYNANVRKAISHDLIPFIKFMSRPGDARRSYLLAGPPGCGKTQLIRDIISMLPKEFTAAIIDSAGLNTLSLFNTALAFVKPLCVIIEDIDLIMENGDQRQVLLNFLDGISSRKQMLTIMTANKPSVLGHVFLRRPGRVDRVIEVLPGGTEERTRQLSILTQGFEVPMPLGELAKFTQGMSFAQHREVVQRARLYSDGTVLDKEQTVCAFQECREQFSVDLADWHEYILPDLPDEIKSQIA